MHSHRLAGLRKEDISGTDACVYVGSFVKGTTCNWSHSQQDSYNDLLLTLRQDYEQVCLRDPDWAPQYAATGNGVAIMANRISYFFDLHGPSMTIDTGCSGSLVSVHLGAQSLRSKESSLVSRLQSDLQGFVFNKKYPGYRCWGWYDSYAKHHDANDGSELSQP